MRSIKQIYFIRNIYTICMHIMGEIADPIGAIGYVQQPGKNDCFE